MTTEHKPQPWFWEAGAVDCPHGAQPNHKTDGDAWDVWRARHPSSDNGPICLDAPAGEACEACSEEHGEMVPWSSCGARKRARRVEQPKAGPIAHAPVTVTGGSLECLELECEEFFDEDGEEIPGKETCSHLSELEICEGCTGPWKDGEFPAVVAWADCPQRLAKAEVSA